MADRVERIIELGARIRELEADVAPKLREVEQLRRELRCLLEGQPVEDQSATGVLAGLQPGKMPYRILRAMMTAPDREWPAHEIYERVRTTVDAGERQHIYTHLSGLAKETAARPALLTRTSRATYRIQRSAEAAAVSPGQLSAEELKVRAAVRPEVQRVIDIVARAGSGGVTLRELQTAATLSPASLRRAIQELHDAADRVGVSREIAAKIVEHQNEEPRVVSSLRAAEKETEGASRTVPETAETFGLTEAQVTKAARSTAHVKKRPRERVGRPTKPRSKE